jgi:hypothetical protein
MVAKAQAYVPSMSDASVRARTGKDWSGWFGALDKAGAARLAHKEIATLLRAKYGLPGWWCQNVTVEYERARGLRARHQTKDGFSVGISKTIATKLPALYAATSAAARRKWFPKGAFQLSSQTTDKYFRGSWNRDARIEMGFYAKGTDKAQIAVQVSRLDSRAEVERERLAWKSALGRLQRLLEK